VRTDHALGRTVFVQRVVGAVRLGSLADVQIQDEAGSARGRAQSVDGVERVDFFV
jgi:hypothetical protein